MRRNVLRELLNDGKPTFSTRMATLCPEIVEIIGLTEQFDFIELLGEYGAWTLPDLASFARTVELFPHMTAMMKVERDPRMFITQRALDAGLQNVLFANCDSADDVRECIRYVRSLTPEDGGLHGCGMVRSVGYVVDGGSPAWVQATRDTVVEVMIESAAAVERLDEILAVPGVDMVHFGPADYALTIGKPGGKGSAEIRRVHRDVIERALKKGVRARVVVNGLDNAREYFDMGVRDFCIGSDLGTLYRWCLANGQKAREMFA